MSQIVFQNWLKANVKSDKMRQAFYHYIVFDRYMLSMSSDWTKIFGQFTDDIIRKDTQKYSIVHLENGYHTVDYRVFDENFHGLNFHNQLNAWNLETVETDDNKIYVAGWVE